MPMPYLPMGQMGQMGQMGMGQMNPMMPMSFNQETQFDENFLALFSLGENNRNLVLYDD